MVSKMKQLTIGKLIELRLAFFERHDALLHDRIHLVKLFIAELLNLPCTMPAEEIAAEFRKSQSGIEMPINDADLWVWAAGVYLGFYSNPRDELITLSRNACSDLRSIDQQLSYIDSEKSRLANEKKSKGRLSAKNRYYSNQLDYYKNKNLAAKSQIIYFITHDLELRARMCASRLKSSPMNMPNVFNRPYRYSSRPFLGLPSPYDVRGLNDLSNKFMDTTAGNLDEMINLYEGSPNEFYEFSRMYIDGELDGVSVRDKILSKVSESHILDRRRRIIEAMLDHYKNKDYLSFVSIAPMQVEGIFADICRELGVTEGELETSSLNDKLAHINERLGGFLFYEYYSFKFPVLRNLVAHGELIDGDLARTSIFLMLDFLPVCDVATQDDLPVNRKLKLMDQIISTRNYNKLLEWIDIESVQIPDFYKKSDDINRVGLMFNDDDFWMFMAEKLKKDEIVIKDGMKVK